MVRRSRSDRRRGTIGGRLARWWGIVYRRGVAMHGDGCHKTIAVAVPGVDHMVGPPAVAHGPTHGGQTGVEGRLTHDLVGPQGCAYLLFGDHAVAMGKEIGEEVE